MIGERIIYLRTLDIDREWFWALLRPSLTAEQYETSASAWTEHGELPQWMLDAESAARNVKPVMSERENAMNRSK
jgi:hypothetical protein